MRFSTAWAKVAAQNVTLKIATVVLAGVAVVQLITIGQLASKDPLVVERVCYSKLVPAKPSDPTADEVKAFVTEALPMRFDSNGFLKEGYLSLEETALRDKELQTLKQRQMIQKVIVSEVKVDGKTIIALADRLISIGKVRSALLLNVNVSAQQTTRTESNPYGLIVTNVSQIEEKEEK